MQVEKHNDMTLYWIWLLKCIGLKAFLYELININVSLYIVKFDSLLASIKAIQYFAYSDNLPQWNYVFANKICIFLETRCLTINYCFELTYEAKLYSFLVFKMSLLSYINYWILLCSFLLFSLLVKSHRCWTFLQAYNNSIQLGIAAKWFWLQNHN